MVPYTSNRPPASPRPYSRLGVVLRCLMQPQRALVVHSKNSCPPVYVFMHCRGNTGPCQGIKSSYPSQCVQAYLQLCAKRHCSGAVLFVDGRTAYYSTLRQVRFDDCSPDDFAFLCDLFTKMDFSEEQQVEVLALIQQGELQRADVPSSLQEFLQQPLSHTWFTMGNGADGNCRIETKCGTVPGNPLVDMLFSYAQAGALRRLRQSLADEGLQVRTVTDSTVAPTPAWADDVAVLLPYRQAQELIPALQRLTCLVEFHSRSIGAKLNFDPGKTEAVCAFRGPGSRAARRAFLRMSTPPFLPATLWSGGLPPAGAELRAPRLDCQPLWLLSS